MPSSALAKRAAMARATGAWTPHVVRALLLFASATLASPALVLAQGSPTRETPRPQDIDPGVNTSAPSQTPAPARESRPEDVDPAVNTSATAPVNEGNSASSPASAGATGSGSSATPTANGATTGATSPTAGASGARRSVTFSGAAAAAAGSTPSPSGSKQTASTKPALGPDGKPVAKGKALDRLELDTTQITGNRELPKVLYIVPWKRSDLGDLTGKPVNSLVDEVLTPVDRDVFKRENRYYRALTPGEGASANGTSAPSSGTSPASASPTGSASPAARDER
jgi:hypothetical protein